MCMKTLDRALYVHVTLIVQADWTSRRRRTTCGLLQATADTMTHLDRRQCVWRAIGKVGDALEVILSSFYVPENKL